MASIRVRHKTIYIDFRYHGKRYRASLGFRNNAKNLRIAEHLASQLESDIRAEKLGLKKIDFSRYFPNWGKEGKGGPNRVKKNFETVFTTWLEEQTHVSKSTMRSWKSSAKNYLLPVLGKKNMTEIKMKEINELIKFMKKKGIKNSTIKKAMCPFKLFLRQMADEGEIENYPIKRLKGVDVEETDVNPFNVEELNKIFGAMKKMFPFFYYFFRFLLLTGTRPSEAVALKWDRIDWQNRKILIREGRVLNVTTRLKTKKSRRDIDISEKLHDLLKRQKEHSAYLNSEYVFTNTLGRPICWENARERFHKVLKASGVAPRCPYQLRHTFASLALLAGEDLAWVSKTLGHASIRTTLDKYARFIPSKGRVDGRKFLSLLDDERDQE